MKNDQAIFLHELPDLKGQLEIPFEIVLLPKIQLKTPYLKVETVCDLRNTLSGRYSRILYRRWITRHTDKILAYEKSKLGNTSHYDGTT